MKITIGDIDIDVVDRNVVLHELKHIPALRVNDDKKSKHNTGIYVQDIEFDPETGYATKDFRYMDEEYYKIDFLNYSPLSQFLSNKQIEKLMNIEPDWNLLKNKDFVEKTTQIHKWFDFLKDREINSVDRLAMAITLIRPAMDHLKYKPWHEIEYLKSGRVWKMENIHSRKAMRIPMH